MDFQQLHVVDGSSDGHSQKSGPANWKPQQTNTSSAWNHAFAYHNSSQRLKPPSPDYGNIQPTLVETNQQINQLGVTRPLAHELQKFGVENQSYTQQLNHVASAVRWTNQALTSNSNLLTADGFPVSLSARRSPHKSASPTVDDLCEYVSVLANKPKPATPYVQSTTAAEGLFAVNRNVFASPTDLLEPELLSQLAQSARVVKAHPECLSKVISKTRMQGRRGKFQLRDKRRSKAFVLSDMLSGLPKAPKPSAISSSTKQVDTAEKAVTLRSKQDHFGGGGQRQTRSFQSPSSQTSAKGGSRRLTRLQLKARKLKQNSMSSSTSRGRNSGGSAVAQALLGGVEKRSSAFRLSSRAVNQISKVRRTQVKFQQNRQRHLAQGDIMDSQPAANVIGAESIGDLQVATFERQHIACAASDGLWKMEKEHIYSQSQFNVSPEVAIRSNGGWQQQRSQNQTPPSRLMAQLTSEHGNTGGGLRSCLTNQNVERASLNNMVNNNREASQSQASSEERELFAIFSGLRVVTISKPARQAGQAMDLKLQMKQQRGVTTTHFEVNGAAQQAALPDRPYRWLNVNPMLSLTPGTYNQVASLRQSSV